jgi:hypothetical protein
VNWRRRLRDLGRAGGTVAVAVTMAGCGTGLIVCNANPDPCCREPQGVACKDEKACLANGGQLGFFPVDDMGGEMFGCGFPRDLGGPDLATPDLSAPHDVGTGD